MRKLILSYLITICFARMWLPFLSPRPLPPLRGPHPPNLLLPQPSPMGGIFSWLFGMGSTFKVQFDLLGPLGSKQATIPEDKVNQLIADLAKTDKAKVKVHIDSWYKIDITMVARKENIDVIEKAVAEGIFLKDLLGNLKELKAAETPGRRILRHHHKDDTEDAKTAGKHRRHDDRHRHQKAEQSEEEQTSNLKISKRRRVDIPGHEEAEKTYVEISLPTKCDCFHEATEANLVDIVSHITALHRSQIKVQTRPSWRIYAMFNEAHQKMSEIQKFYFNGEFEKQLNAKLQEYHILDNTATASTKQTAELSVAGSDSESSKGKSPSLPWILGGLALAIISSSCGLKMYTEKRRAQEFNMAFLPTENVVLEDDFSV